MGLPNVEITAVIATLVGYTTALLLGLIIRAIYSELLYSIILSIYMGPVARQVDHQKKQLSAIYSTAHTYTFSIPKIVCRGGVLARRRMFGGEGIG